MGDVQLGQSLSPQTVFPRHRLILPRLTGDVILGILPVTRSFTTLKRLVGGKRGTRYQDMRCTWIFTFHTEYHD